MSSSPVHPSLITGPPIRDPDVLARMEIAFDLYDTAEQLMRQNLRRRNPAASDDEIEKGIREWLRHRALRAVATR